ncbi:Sec-independent protein translocase subunit TatA/TatB [Algihabitans albus]|uniref:Sec-independent protein translocase subunit TatA/TatB n=1 Tax=Algihabitans albus TaxID=2164067 RepID=UPI000E5D18EB|nr:twin-arginine translocase TatA/TatE family subunit [Algihabitans albus]
MGISFWQIAIVVLIVVLLFGAGKIPRLMKDVGSGINQFKRGLKEESNSDENSEEASSAKLEQDKETATTATAARSAETESKDDKKVANG